MSWTREELAAAVRRGARTSDESLGSPPAPAASPRNKYGAKRTQYNGVWYASKLEAKHAALLDLRVMAGDIKSWRRQVPVIVNWPGTEDMVLRCRVDFEITHNDGSVTFLECKGYKVRDWPLRFRILKLAGVPLEVVR